MKRTLQTGDRVYFLSDRKDLGTVLMDKFGRLTVFWDRPDATGQYDHDGVNPDGHTDFQGEARRTGQSVGLEGALRAKLWHDTYWELRAAKEGAVPTSGED